MREPPAQDAALSWAGPLCTAFILVFSPLIDGGTTQLPMLVMRLVVIGGFMVWLIDRMRRGSLHLLVNSIGPPAVAFLAWTALSLLWSPYKTASAQWLLTLLLYGGLFVLARHSFASQEHRCTAVSLLLSIGAMEGLLGLIQFCSFGAPRATGTFFNPNFFAAYEGAMLVLSLGLLSYAAPVEKRPWRRTVLWASAAIGAASFVTAQSRGALVALLAVLFIGGVLRFGKRALGVLLVTVIVGALAPNPLRERIMEVPIQDPYAYTRLDIWKHSWSRSLDHPWGLGVGMYKYGSFHDRFPIEGNIVHYRKRAESAHNEYLQLLDELGVIGIATFLLVIGKWLWEARLGWHAQRCSQEKGLLLGCTGAVLLLLLHAGVDSVFHEPALVIVLLVCGAMVHRLYDTTHPTALRWRALPLTAHPGWAWFVATSGLILSVLSIQPAAAWYAHEQGKHEAGDERYQSAMRWYERAVAIDPGTTGYHDSLARTAVQLFHESGDAQWLITASEEQAIARDLNRLDARFPYRLGTIYALMADRPEFHAQRNELLGRALGCFADAIAADPYSPFNYFELAQLHLAEGRVEQSIALLNRAKTYEPNYLPGRALLAELSLKQGLPGDYEQELRTLRALQSTYESEVTDELDRQYLHVDLSPLARAIAAEAHR